MRVLIYGGLTAVGASITNYFLQEGIETMVMKSTPFTEGEEEQELYFGRNALYRALESRSELGRDDSIDTVCFSGHFDEKKKEELFKNLETVLKDFRKVETVILLSHTVVGEGGEDEQAGASEKVYFHDVERKFSSRFESREKTGKCRLFIVRLPKELIAMKPNKVNEMAKTVFELAGCQHKNGIHTFRLVRNEEQRSEERGDGAPFIVEEIQSIPS